MNRFRHQKLCPSWLASTARWPHKLYRRAIPILQKQRLLGETRPRSVTISPSPRQAQCFWAKSAMQILQSSTYTHTRTIRKWLENACKHKKRLATRKKKRYTSRKNINHQNSGALQHRFVPHSVFGQPTAARHDRRKREHTLYRLFGTEMYNSNCQRSAFIARQAAISFFFPHAPVALQCSRQATSSQGAAGGGLQG